MFYVFYCTQSGSWLVEKFRCGSAHRADSSLQGSIPTHSRRAIINPQGLHVGIETTFDMKVVGIKMRMEWALHGVVLKLRTPLRWPASPFRGAIAFWRGWPSWVFILFPFMKFNLYYENFLLKKRIGICYGILLRPICYVNNMAEFYNEEHTEA